MKKITFLFLILFTALGYSQVTISPNPFELNQPITITVDANSTATDCNGFSSPNKIYMHSGVGDDTNAWVHTVGNWGDDDGVGEMTPNGDGTWSINIFPLAYYSLSTAEADNVTQMGMVFRSEDGSQEFKDNGCSDFFFPVGAFQLNLIAPTNNITIVNSGNSISITATTSLAADFNLKANGTSINTSTNSTSYSFSPTITENTSFVLEATNGGTTLTKSFQVIVPPTVVQEAIPTGIVQGINYDDTDPTKVTLALFAPNKDFTHVAGSFNNYSFDNNYVMKQDVTNSDLYWLEITGLTSGQIETYQYWVTDQTPIADSPNIVKTADPFSTLVLSPFDDPYIPVSTYPNLPAYPSGQDREVTVLQTGQTAYNWQVTNFAKPKKEDLVIYEVLIRDFDADRNFQDLIDKIDYFKNLNVNAIELMPIMEYEGNESWGYNTSFHMALDKFYGTEDKFKEFVDLCHQNGIAVILDIALNHAFGRNPMNRMWMDDPDGDGWGEPSSENPYFNQVATHSYSVGSDFNHQQPATQNYVERVIKHWIEEFNIDGFRWDLTKGFTQNATGSDALTNSYQTDRVVILKQYADYSWSLDADHYVIFEHLGDNGEETEWANYRVGEGKGIMLWGKMTDPYNELTMGQNGNKNISGMGHDSRGFSEPRLVGYAESHDEERLMYKNMTYGASGISGNLTASLGRMSALGAVSLTIPGPKMIWHFGELGMENSIFTCNNGSYDNDGCKLDTKPQPQWVNNWLGDANRSQIYNDWARLNELKIYEAVFEGDYTITSGSFTPRIDIFDTTIPTDELRNVIVLANFDTSTQTVNTNFPTGGDWYDLMDETGSTTYSNATISIPAGQFRIFGNQAATLSVDDFETLSDFAIYPNPVNSTFAINANISSLNIYDITGKLINEYKGSFTQGELFDVSNLNQGIYIIELENDKNQKTTTKLIKL